MSKRLETWAWTIQDLPLVAKVILIVFCDESLDDGKGSWATPDMLRARVSDTSDSTIKRHTGTLLSEGYIREGDQNRISEDWLGLPRHFRPIVYDIAGDDETRLAWKAAYDPDAGRRGAAARNGRAARLARKDVTPHDDAIDDAAGQPSVKMPHDGLSKCHTDQVSRFGETGVSKCHTFIRTKDSLTKDFKEGGGNPPTPLPDEGMPEAPPESQPPVLDPVATAIAAAVVKVRPRWRLTDVIETVTPYIERAYDPVLIGEVAMAAANDPATMSLRGRFPHMVAERIRGVRFPVEPELKPVPAGPVKVPWPEDLVLTDAMRRSWHQAFPLIDVDYQFRLCKLHYLGTGDVKADWYAVAEAWMARAQKWAKESAGRPAAAPAQQQTTADERAAAHRDAERYEAGEISLSQYVLGGTRRQPETLPSQFVHGEVVS